MAEIAHEATESKGVDTDLYSRIIPILGAGNLKKLMGLKVLISGMRGLGAEIAKDLSLTGVGSITIHDTENVEIADLSSHFYLQESDIGKNRAKSCVDRLAELNPYSQTNALTEPLTYEILSQFQVVVLTNNKSLSQLKDFGAYCHNHNPAIVFIVADTFGLVASIFADFGPKHRIFDSNGEEAVQSIVTLISKGKSAVVHTLDDKPHGLGTGDYVQFKEVKGMTEINFEPSMSEKSPLAAIKVTDVKGLYGFEIELDTSEFGSYVSHGLVTQVKVIEKMKSKPFHESLVYPGEFIISDFAKFGRAEQFHFGYQALLIFKEKNGFLPRIGNEQDINDFIQIAKDLNEVARVAFEREDKEKKERAEKEAKEKEEREKEPQSNGHPSTSTASSSATPTPPPPTVHYVSELDEKLLRTLATLSRGDLTPMNAFVGGVVAQEIMKATGKFKPLNQWFHFDSLEALPLSAEKDNYPAEDRQPIGSRYDAQIAVFGKKFQEKLSNLAVFLVGAGALGCELGKNFAMMGVSTGDTGLLTITDMDNIEKSNLSRQFLFRPGDIGKMKSTCAKAVIKRMNKELKVKSSEIPVGPDTETTWSDAFWESQDIIVNALDNIKARLYVDTKCVEFHIPLLESGTQGTKANTQVILPKFTESYGTSRDPPDQGIPMCTLKNFPHQIEHTIEWGRDKFQGFFTNSFEDANLWIKGEDLIKQVEALDSVVNQRERLENVAKILELSRGIDFEKCVEWARLQFEEMFHNTIEQLLYNFPLDATTTTGAPFWSGPKRPPTSLKFNPKDSEHMAFIVAAANVLAYNFGIKGTHSLDEIESIVTKIKLPSWKPRTGIKIKAEEKDSTTEGSEDDDATVKHLKEVLKGLDRKNYVLFHPAAFEKDEDSNFHIAFMTAASNLRALNYNIPIADFQKTKKIAGRIIPAIATTTAMITGLVCLEFYKLIEDAPLERYRNSFVNLALPSFVQSEPMPCKVNKSDLAKNIRCYPEGWTLWDKLVVDAGDITFNELIKYFQEKFNMTPISITYGRTLIYNPLIPNHKDRINVKVSDQIKKIDPCPIGPSDKYVDLVILAEDMDNDLLEVELPDPVRYRFAP